MIHLKHINTPLGKLIAEANHSGITRLCFSKNVGTDRQLEIDEVAVEPLEVNPLLVQLQFELDEYFSGARKTFSVPVDPAGTSFQKSVWKALLEIPHGTTVTYLQLAKSLKLPDAVRAVAGANAKNPIMILIPCHRVNGTNGSLTGYAGGLAAKKFLLELESGRKIPQQMVMEFP